MNNVPLLVFFFIQFEIKLEKRRSIQTIFVVEVTEIAAEDDQVEPILSFQIGLWILDIQGSIEVESGAENIAFEHDVFETKTFIVQI